jgi:hypothetical protein
MNSLLLNNSCKYFFSFVFFPGEGPRVKRVHFALATPTSTSSNRLVVVAVRPAMSKLGRVFFPCWLQRFNKRPWKLLFSVAAWACAVVFLVLAFGSKSDHVVLVGSGTGTGVGAGLLAGVDSSNVNGRLLLQKVVETKATPTPTTPMVGYNHIDLKVALSQLR